jgi:hypothetical protein
MISIKRIVEQQGYEGQYYDLGRDFANFRRTIDGTGEQIKQKFEQSIGTKLNGKRIRAQASRGYKQFVKQYEFDVVKITLDDYYDNYVVVAQDNTTPKAKEYFLKPGFKIQILGMATGQPSPQKGDKPGDEKPEQPPIPNPVQPGQNPNSAQHQSMAQAPAGNTPSEQPVKENESVGSYDAYAIDSISRDIEPWLKTILRKPETAMRDFIKGLGWLKDLGRGTVVTMFDLKIPSESLSKKITPDEVRNMLARSSKTGGTIDVKYDLVKMEPNDTNDEWKIRVKKTMTNRKYE